MHGWLILDKPHGLGSTQAVSAVKRALRQSGAGKWKVGHGGTLDPLATGVLPIAIGEATKLAGRMLDSDKIYDFTVTFGTQTDTLDLEGKVIAESDHRPTLGEVEAILPRFTGPIEQAPPAYSAILIDGQRAYDLARAGQDVEMKLRSVMIYELQISSLPKGGEDSVACPHGGLAELGEGQGASSPSPTPARQQAAKPPYPLPASGERIQQITLRAHVSKGTYIRSLARDIAIALGTVGHVTMLRRLKAGPFTLESAISLDKLDEAARGHGIAQLMLPLTAGLDDIPALAVSPDDALALRQGKVLVGKPHTGLMLAMEGDTPVALVEASGPEIRVVRGFNL
ncbi:tRNA pseudouridine(55) synthase TruB [Sphingomonadales bacterium 56]|uniref:tRNA pseudouridine(55) synthase TruB n=1 Tax=unclassified Sphingobium TaxID=2611147 RepID=UPI0019186DFF|nr:MULTISPECIES: tRNA pseudouridine(55) synthase TruB [unclassified Sphingobium]MBY2927333.1 tRNA pseudouridine(55) synthase TruB [Sphingomonadales bacterium 56]MBY2957401.1 tRNA pseudouridine(55) synthase TruB [Sphingomonadales bacterium 58]